jgi:signal transduction histidine kinase
MKTLRNIALALLLILIASKADSKIIGDYKMVVDEIRLNGKPLPPNAYNDIVIAREDSILFMYHCEAGDANKRPLLFKINLRNSKQSYTPPPSNIKLAIYANLPEDFYELTISAFEPLNEIVIMPCYIKFRVDTREAKARKEYAKLQAKLAVQDSLLAKVTPKKQLFGKFDLLSIFMGLLFGIIVAIIIFVIVKMFKKSASESGNVMEKGPQINKSQLDKITAENSSLRAEIAALRGQIDALQHRGDELRKQNRELEDNSDKLSSSKSELEELQKQKDELFAVIIHDIKNPVALIKSLVELLRSYDLTATEQHEIIDDIFETTTRIVSLSQEVSKILALESSVLHLEIEKVNINEIIKDVHRRYEKAAATKGIEMFLELNPNIPQVEIDINKVDDVIDNLINNAIKFTNLGGKIKITNSSVDNNLIVEVSDNGVGLSEADVKMAFQRGSRLSAKPTGSEHSSGLGLWIVKKLIDAHSGRVWIKSALGKGSTFAFAVPLKQKDRNYPVLK